MQMIFNEHVVERSHNMAGIFYLLNPSLNTSFVLSILLLSYHTHFSQHHQVDAFYDLQSIELQVIHLVAKIRVLYTASHSALICRKRVLFVFAIVG